MLDYWTFLYVPRLHSGGGGSSRRVDTAGYKQLHAVNTFDSERSGSAISAAVPAPAALLSLLLGQYSKCKPSPILKKVKGSSGWWQLC